MLNYKTRIILATVASIIIFFLLKEHSSARSWYQYIDLGIIALIPTAVTAALNVPLKKKIG